MLRPPVEPMLAATVRTLPEPSRCRGGCGYEPKWDGWRCLAFGNHRGHVYLQSRAGKPLTTYFPDVTRLVREHLPPNVVVDGELVIWEPDGHRTSFVRLQHRVAAGARVLSLAREAPAYLVLFDLLQDADGRALLSRPLSERRELLADLLNGVPPQLALAPHTTDVDEARQWHDTWVVAGVEGLVIKGLATPYRPGVRGWSKLRHRRSTLAIVGGVTGTWQRPESVLAGRLNHRGSLSYLGRTNLLTDHQAAALAVHLRPPEPRSGGSRHPWPRPLPAAWSPQLDQRDPLPYVQVDPVVVVDVEVDTAYEYHRWRHGARYLRIRTDLSVGDVPLLS